MANTIHSMMSEANQKTLEEIYLKIPQNKRLLFGELIKEILRNAENDTRCMDFFSPVKWKDANVEHPTPNVQN